MSNKLTRHAATLLTMLFAPFAFASGDDEDREEGTAETASVPDTIRLAVTREYPRGAIVESTIERHELGDAWRVRVQDRLATRELVLDPGGVLVAQAEDVPVSATPAHIRRAVSRQFGSPSLWHVQHFSGVGEDAWLVTFSRGERSGRALFDGEGRLVRGELEPMVAARGDRRQRA